MPLSVSGPGKKIFLPVHHRSNGKPTGAEAHRPTEARSTRRALIGERPG